MSVQGIMILTFGLGPDDWWISGVVLRPKCGKLLADVALEIRELLLAGSFSRWRWARRYRSIVARHWARLVEVLKSTPRWVSW